ELNGFELSDLDGAGPDLIGRLISAAENHPEKYAEIFEAISEQAGRSHAPIVGLTGTGGSGKSSLADELLRSLLSDFADLRFAVISVDPSRRRGTGALLGDRIRMNSIPHPRAYMRSLATRQANLALSPSVHTAIDILKAAGYDLVILETSGIGQADTEIVDHADLSLYVMTPEYGAATQLEKIDMLDFADVIAVNKADKVGADDALREVRKQYRRNHQLFNAADDDLPVFLTTASAFGDLGTERVYRAMLQRLAEKQPSLALSRLLPSEHPRRGVVPGNRTRYLGEIVDEVRAYDSWVDQQADAAETWYRLSGVEDSNTGAVRQAEEAVDPANRTILERWEATAAEYAADQLAYPVRGKEVRAPLYQETLSHTRLPKVSLPKYRSWGDRLRWVLQENVPGEFPFTAGVFELKRKEEEPTRMFAGEGPPEQTNARFHYLASGMPARRLSTAFDSVTLYGHEPARRPDIYGKVGNSGVSVATLDDAKRLYSGFDLCDPATSVSMTINGPAPMILAYFLNAAIDQQCELHIRREGLEGEVEARLGELHPEGRPIYHGDLPEGHNGLGLMLLGATGDQVLPAEVYERIKADTLRTVRGTVQADILKEDQAQNTCIFSTEFGLRMMGDIQQYFVDHS
ncbi:MAG TPA: methylmalonyl-CoA mutase family protein, partial [Acidimicrobiia bacterium]